MASERRTADDGVGGATGASPSAPEVKFQEMLAALIAGSPYNTNRRAIWEHVGISSAALSQYVLGRARPRFETLCLLADFFGVSLDYLVRGREPSGTASVLVDERDVMARHVDWTIADVRERASAHAWFVSRIGQAIAEKMDEVALDVLPLSPRSGDILTDNEVVRLECLSVHSKMIAPNLQLDLVSANDRVLPGRFARIAAANLNRGRQYQILLPGDVGWSWSPVIHAYRRLLTEMGVLADGMKRYRCFVTDQPVFTGVYLYKIDLVTLGREDPYFYEAIQPYVSEDNWVGFSRHAHGGAPGPGTLFERENLERSLESFDRLWSDALRGAAAGRGAGSREDQENGLVDVRDDLSTKRPPQREVVHG